MLLAAGGVQWDVILGEAAAGVVISGAIIGSLRWFIRYELQTIRDERDEERRLTEAVAKKLGVQPLGEPEGPSIAQTVEAVAHQVKPSNGVTLAKTVEEVRAEMMRLAVLVGEHMSDGHGGQVWPGVK